MTLENVRETWTYRNMHTLITLSLFVALIWVYWGDSIKSLLPANEPIQYVQACAGLDCIIHERTQAIYERDQWLYWEQAKTEALESIGREVVGIMYEPVEYEQVF